ncbi:MAG: flagellar filament capping protein FliD [Proteobacteria bacterium]|nr:flagellar filament capping protein FliD [Pseudomonadota bacterium]
MSTISSTAGTLSSPGIGSGLDVNSIISKMMSVEAQPLYQLQAQQSSIQSTISAYGTVQSTLSSFQTAVQALTAPSLWSGTTATSADSTTIGAATDSTAVPGNYAITVSHLATNQSTVSGTYSSSSDLVGSGTLHIDTGSWNSDQSAFTATSGSSGFDISISSTDTLADVASKINGAGAGVTASVVTDSTGARLVLSSGQTGASNGFRVTATDDDGNNTDGSGLSSLAFDPAGGTTTSTQTQAGTDATATINGLPITSASNTLTNVVQGLTLNLSKETTSPIQVSVAADTKSITTAINNFVTAYNSMSTLLTADLKYDSGTQTSGPLQGDSTAVSLQQQLRSIIGSPSTASSVFSTLSQIGIQVQTNGTLSVNSTTLSQAMTNLPELKKAFAATSTDGSSGIGFAQQLLSYTNNALGADGLLTTRVAGLNTSLQNNEDDQANMQTMLSATQARLTAQYNALDTQMASITTLSTYVSQQIAQWNKTSS